MIRHLGGQIKHRSRSKWKSINVHPNTPIINFEMKSDIQWIKRWVRSMCQDICIKSITCCYQFGKGTVDIDFSLLHTSTKGTMMLLSESRQVGALYLEVPDLEQPHELSHPPPFFTGVLHILLLPSSTSVWNQRSLLIQSHRFMNTCTECSVSL